MAEIRIHSADGTERTLRVTRDRLTVGRSRESDIHLPDQWLSRRHAEIQRRPEGFFVVDLKSKNGTLLNDRPVEGEARLTSGDVIVLGEHRLAFVEESASPVTDERDAVPPGTLVFSAREMMDSLAVAGSPMERPGPEKRIIGLLTGATTALFTHRPLPEIFEQILELLLDAIPGAERAAVLLIEGSPPKPVIKASRARSGEIITSVSRSIARKVVEERVVLLVPNGFDDRGLSAQESILASGIHSALCAPLWYREPESDQDAVIGLVYLDARWHANAFTEEDRPIVTALANVAAAKIENARLLEESLEKRRMEDDIRMAAEIQASLLPREAPRLAGWDLVGSTRPCHAVGGDYFDLLAHERELLMALGDVSGKGTGAALLMTMLRAAVRAHWKEAPAADAVAGINQTVYENTPGNKYITFFLARLERETGRVSYVNAGHNPPIVARANGVIETLTEGGIVLGLVDGAKYAEGSVVLGPGDTLLVYSDGVTETWSPDDEEFGEKRLEEIVTRGRGLDARSLESEILRQLERFSAGVKATDDRTLIVLKRT